MQKFSRKLALTLFGVAALAVHAEVLERPEGIKIGKRMTLRPYVSLSIAYDSNVRSSHDSDGDAMWSVSPGLGLSYNAENWSLLASGYYSYRDYFKSENSEYDQHSYGQDLRWNWANSLGGEKGWSLVLGESFQQITMADDMTLGDGRNYSCDSRQFQFSGAVQRRFNERWHGDVNGNYYWLDYDNNDSSLNSMYGWDRWMVGSEVGFAPSKWTDILLAGSYQGFTQDNTTKSGISSDSSGYTVQGGVGSYMTDRISYRLLLGWSRFDYGGGDSSDGGLVYTASGNWKIGETWNTMLLATSYYQPSERQYTSSSRVDAFSWGIAKLLIRGKLRSTLDFRYRRDTNDYAGDMAGNYDYVINVLTARLGFDYNLNRFLAFFVSGEYQKSMNDESSSRGHAYDYDRWRLTAGLRLKY